MSDPPCFEGFAPATFDWFDDLAADNSRAAFDATAQTYADEVRGPFTALLRSCAAWNGGEWRVFRQLRDLRFAKNRDRPYWESIAGEIIAPAASSSGVRVADLSARGLCARAGYRRPFTGDQLARFRAAVDDEVTGPDLDRLVRALAEAGAEIGGATLRTVPRGTPRHHPRAQLLRHTALIASGTLAPERQRRLGVGHRRVIAADAALAHLASTWREFEPLTCWLDAHVGAPAGQPSAAAA